MSHYKWSLDFYEILKFDSLSSIKAQSSIVLVIKILLPVRKKSGEMETKRDEYFRFFFLIASIKIYNVTYTDSSDRLFQDIILYLQKQ